MKHVLVLGAGQSSACLVARLLDMATRFDWSVRVGDFVPEAAARLVGSHPRGEPFRFDVNDSAGRSAAIAAADVVVNMLPPSYLDLVAWDCVAQGRHMMSVSYRDEAVRRLDADARAKGILILCELGLDPGIDHMSAMALIRRIEGEGGRIVAFQSYGSGVPAPDQPQNPLRYAITWNPRNVVMAGENGAQYMRDGRIKIVPYHHVFHHTWKIDVPGVGAMEAYPNRDSLSYMRAFGLGDVSTMIRGTLRWPGWCETWNQIVRLGLPNEKLRIPDLATRSYGEVVDMFLPMTVTRPDLQTRIARFLNISPTGRIMSNLEWLGLLSDEPTGCRGETAAAMLVELMKRKMPLAPGERDMVILDHHLEVEYPGTDRAPERVRSTLVAYGDPAGQTDGSGQPVGFTAMSRTVGLPVAIAVKQLLTGELALTGSHIPTDESIYRPGLAELAGEGLEFTESVSPLEPAK